MARRGSDYRAIIEPPTRPHPHGPHTGPLDGRGEWKRTAGGSETHSPDPCHLTQSLLTVTVPALGPAHQPRVAEFGPAQSGELTGIPAQKSPSKPWSLSSKQKQPSCVFGVIKVSLCSLSLRPPRPRRETSRTRIFALISQRPELTRKHTGRSPRVPHTGQPGSSPTAPSPNAQFLASRLRRCPEQTPVGQDQEATCRQNALLTSTF